jgi:hypothetical protein
MQHEMPFYELPEDAIKASVQSLGGYKAVGPMLWPHKSVEQASKYLMDCLNPDRNEKLDYGELVFIFQRAKASGFNAGFEWFAHQCEYEARAITRAEEVDRLTSVIESSSKTLAGALALLQQMQATKIQK